MMIKLQANYILRRLSMTCFRRHPPSPFFWPAPLVLQAAVQRRCFGINPAAPNLDASVRKCNALVVIGCPPLVVEQHPAHLPGKLWAANSGQPAAAQCIVPYLRQSKHISCLVSMRVSSRSMRPRLTPPPWVDVGVMTLTLARGWLRHFLM